MVAPIEAARLLKERLKNLERRARPQSAVASVLETHFMPFSKRAAVVQHFRLRLRQLLQPTLELVRSTGGWDQPLLDLATDDYLYADCVDDAIAELDQAIRKVEKASQKPQEPQPPCTVEYKSPDLAIVGRGTMSFSVRGPRRVWLLRRVVEAGRALTWSELVMEDLQGAAETLARRQRGARKECPIAAPKMATASNTLQNLGGRIRKDLRELGIHWQQNGLTVQWTG